MLRAYFGPSASPVGEVFFGRLVRVYQNHGISWLNPWWFVVGAGKWRMILMGEWPFDEVNQAGAVSIRPVSLKITAKTLGKSWCPLECVDGGQGGS